jgi:hypothetical protein
MRQDQLEHAIRTACQIIGRHEVIVVGFSPFEELHGFSIDGADLTTSALPTGWRGRLVKVQNANTGAPEGDPNTQAGASTRKTYASPSSAPSGKRTGIS